MIKVCFSLPSRLSLGGNDFSEKPSKRIMKRLYDGPEGNRLIEKLQTTTEGVETRAARRFVPIYAFSYVYV